MTTNAVATYLKFANLQMAAEAIFPDAFSGGIATNTLTTGNNRSSKFTTVLAEQFAKDWKVVAHRADTNTGFSGTLFECQVDDPARGLVRGELVMSFRSTEFADDAARDNEATNVLEVKEFGWGFGQIDDMKKWVDGLYASGKISPTSALSVTGYSLGGHLATAFNLVYPGAAKGTYTFNGAGVGVVNRGSLTQVIAQFDRQRMNVSGNEIKFTDPQATIFYNQMQPAAGDRAPRLRARQAVQAPGENGQAPAHDPGRGDARSAAQARRDDCAARRRRRPATGAQGHERSPSCASTAPG
jgi:pimeloyl-ACP methyl ester carboxylesterase